MWFDGTHLSDCDQPDGHGLITEDENRCDHFHTFLCEDGGPSDTAEERFTDTFLGEYDDAGAYVRSTFEDLASRFDFDSIGEEIPDSYFDDLADTWQNDGRIYTIDRTYGPLVFKGPSWIDLGGGR